MLCLLVSVWFQVLFHSPPGVLFTFPSRYYSAIGHQVVFSLGGWSPLLPTRFHVPCGTLVPAALLPLSPTGLLPPLVPLSSGVRLDSSVALPARNPGRPKTSGLGSSPFARRYLEHRSFFPFLRLLRCFSSPGSLCNAMNSHCSDRLLHLPGFPIRISADYRLFAAPRSFSHLTTSFFGS